MSPWYHAMSSVKKHGGQPEDYADLHNWFDETKSLTGNWTYRALRHHAAGIEEAIRMFGHCIVRKSDEVKVSTKVLAEQHVTEDCGFIPTVAHWFKPLSEHPDLWMLRVKTKSKDLNEPT